MKNLNDLKEQIQEDIITYFDQYDFLESGINIEEVCQIVVDRTTELEKTWLEEVAKGNHFIFGKEFFEKRPLSEPNTETQPNFPLPSG